MNIVLPKTWLNAYKHLFSCCSNILLEVFSSVLTMFQPSVCYAVCTQECDSYVCTARLAMHCCICRFLFIVIFFSCECNLVISDSIRLAWSFLSLCKQNYCNLHWWLNPILSKSLYLSANKPAVVSVWVKSEMLSTLVLLSRGRQTIEAVIFCPS